MTNDWVSHHKLNTRALEFVFPTLLVILLNNMGRED